MLINTQNSRRAEYHVGGGVEGAVGMNDVSPTVTTILTKVDGYSICMAEGAHTFARTRPPPAVHKRQVKSLDPQESPPAPSVLWHFYVTPHHSSSRLSQKEIFKKAYQKWTRRRRDKGAQA